MRYELFYDLINRLSQLFHLKQCLKHVKTSYRANFPFLITRNLIAL